MARRTPQRGSKKSVKRAPGATPASLEIPVVKIPGNLNSGKIILIVALVLAVLYGPGFFKNVFKPEPKYFLVKKIAQVSGTETLGTPFFANDIAVVGPDEFAITDQLKSQVLLYKLDGKLVRHWGTRGTGPKELQEPAGIVYDGKGHLYVMDTWNGAIKEFDLTGKLLKTIDLSKQGLFYGPRRIGWAGDSLLVSNASNSTLARLSLDGDVLSVWQGKDKMGQVSSAILDSKGHIAVGDANGDKGRVQIFDPSGKLLQGFKTGVPPEDIAFDSKGRLFVGCYGFLSKVFDSNGDWLGFLADVDHPTDALGQVMGIEITSNDKIFICGGDWVSVYQLDESKGK